MKRKKQVDLVNLNGRIAYGLVYLKQELEYHREKIGSLLSYIEELENDYTALANEIAKQTKKSKK